MTADWYCLGLTAAQFSHPPFCLLSSRVARAQVWPMLRLLSSRLLKSPLCPPRTLLRRSQSPQHLFYLSVFRTMATSGNNSDAAAATAVSPSSAAAAAALANADAEQARLMSERVLLVDVNDSITGSASKVDAHLLSGGLPLHRAFSVFLFDADRRLCLQRRAGTKLTFPGYWTNTCCSHPLAGGAEVDGVEGAAVAAVRKLGHELGITAGGDRGIAVDDLVYMTRVHYRAASGGAGGQQGVGGGTKVDVGDGGEDPTAAAAAAGAVWGEHEIDYVFVATKDVDVVPEPNEVSELAWVGPDRLRAMLNGDGGVAVTPWCRAIAERFVFEWWPKVDDRTTLVSHRDADTIHRFGDW